MLLVPLLVAALQMQPTQDEVEEALTAGVREKLAAGWTLVDVRNDDDEILLTVTKNGAIEQHVGHLDRDASYRIDVLGQLPADLIAPNAFALQALAGGGGVEMQPDCGHVYPRFYMREGKERGAAAAKLVSSTLAASSDVERADVSASGRALFVIEVATKANEIRVTLDDDRIVAAEVRRYEFGPDVTTYRRQRAMKRAAAKGITSITAAGYGLVLVAGTRRFEIDPETFEPNFPDDHSCGC